MISLFMKKSEVKYLIQMFFFKKFMVWNTCLLISLAHQQAMVEIKIDISNIFIKQFVSHTAPALPLSLKGG